MNVLAQQMLFLRAKYEFRKLLTQFASTLDDDKILFANVTMTNLPNGDDIYVSDQQFKVVGRRNSEDREEYTLGFHTVRIRYCSQDFIERGRKVAHEFRDFLIRIQGTTVDTSEVKLVFRDKTGDFTDYAKGTTFIICSDFEIFTV